MIIALILRVTYSMKCFISISWRKDYREICGHREDDVRGCNGSNTTQIRNKYNTTSVPSLMYTYTVHRRQAQQNTQSSHFMILAHSLDVNILFYEVRSYNSESFGSLHGERNICGVVQVMWWWVVELPFWEIRLLCNMIVCKHSNTRTYTWGLVW